MSTLTYERVDVNYARLSYSHELFHIVAHGKRLKPRATALCGIKRDDIWEDCRVRRPEQVCAMCDRKLHELETQCKHAHTVQISAGRCCLDCGVLQ